MLDAHGNAHSARVGTNGARRRRGFKLWHAHKSHASKENVEHCRRVPRVDSCVEVGVHRAGRHRIGRHKRCTRYWIVVDQSVLRCEQGIDSRELTVAVGITKRKRSCTQRASAYGARFPLLEEKRAGFPSLPAGAPYTATANQQGCTLASVNGRVGWLQVGGRRVCDFDDATPKHSGACNSSRRECDCSEMPVVAAGVVGGDAPKPDHAWVV